MGATGSGLIAVLDFFDGRTLRFGGDGADAYSRPDQIKFQTSLPGGHGPGSIVIPRADWWDSSNAAMLAGVRVIDEQGRNVYEGRVSGAPKPDLTHVEIQTEGWAKHLEDDETAAIIFIDRDLNAWQAPSNQRQINMVMAGVKMVGSFEVATDLATGNPCLKLRLDSLGTVAMRAEAWYIAAPLSIAGVYYDVVNHDNPTLNGMAAANWTEAIELSQDDVATGFTSTGDLLTNPDAAYFTVSLPDPTPKKAATIYIQWEGSSAVAEGDWTVDWRKLTVIGDHGLPHRYEPGQSEPYGLYVSDMVNYAVDRWAPALTVGPDSIELTNSFTVPHAVFKDPTTAKAMVESLVLYGGNSNYPLDWFVYDDRQFQLKSPGAYGRTWRSRLDEGAKPSREGPDASNRLNGVRVSYDPGDGTVKSVGPPGSGATTETALMTITDPNHPANRAGIRKWRNYAAGILSDAGATLVGQQIMAEANRDEWRGSVDLAGDQRDSAGNPNPCYMMRSGDQIVLEDDEDTRPRRIISTDYDSKRRNEMQVSIGQKPDRLDVLLARAGIALMGSAPSQSPAPSGGPHPSSGPGSGTHGGNPRWGG